MKRKIQKQVRIQEKRARTKKQVKQEASRSRITWTGLRPCVYKSKKRSDDDSWKKEEW